LLPEEVEEDPFPQTAIADYELVVAKYAHDRYDKDSSRNNQIALKYSAALKMC
jgi:hypothetical protein